MGCWDLAHILEVEPAAHRPIRALLKGHTKYVMSVVFNHDGTKIASGSYDNSIKVWNVSTGECISTLKGHTDDVNSVAFNHDGTKIASGFLDNSIKVWNVSTGECISTLKGHTNSVSSVAFNHDGTKVHDYRSPSTRTILVRVVWQLSPFDLLHVQHEVLALQRAGVIRHPIEIHQQCAKVIVVQVVGVKVNPVFPVDGQ